MYHWIELKEGIEKKILARHLFTTSIVYPINKNRFPKINLVGKMTDRHLDNWVLVIGWL